MVKRKTGKTPKQKILEILEKLPDDSTFEQVVAAIRAFAKKGAKEKEVPKNGKELLEYWREIGLVVMW